MKFDKKSLLLYAVTDRAYLNGRTLYECCESAIKGGATFIQIREKELESEEFISEAKKIKKLCKKYNIPFAVNDNVDVAMSVDADGVHVGQKDMRAKNVRELIGDEKILGVSVQTAEQAKKAEADGADYLGVGTVFPTNSKSDAEYVDWKTLKEICNSVNIPVIAIGGIGCENISKLKDSGICGAAAISSVFACEDIEKGTAKLKKCIKRVVEE